MININGVCENIEFEVGDIIIDIVYMNLIVFIDFNYFFVVFIGSDVFICRYEIFCE